MGHGKDATPRTRRKQTLAETEKKARQKRKQTASQELGRRANEQAARQQFVQQLSDAPPEQATAAPEAAADASPDEQGTNADQGGDEGGRQQPAAESTAAESPHPRRAVRYEDVSVTEEDELEGDDDDDDEGTSSKVESPMTEYARGILKRLRLELKDGFDDKNDSRWLLKELKANGWWIYAAHARSTMEQLSASSDPTKWPDPFYYRDIFVFLPDVRWPDEQIRCPRCKSSRTGLHDYQLGHPSRSCTDLFSSVHLMGRRHICHECHDKYAARPPASPLHPISSCPVSHPIPPHPIHLTYLQVRHRA